MGLFCSDWWEARNERRGPLLSCASSPCAQQSYSGVRGSCLREKPGKKGTVFWPLSCILNRAGGDAGTAAVLFSENY
jgi:hypothetical protein